MRRFLAIIALVLQAAFAVPIAQAADSTLQITQPKLQIPVPGLTLTQAVINGTQLSAPYLAQYISGVYKFLLSVVGVVAAVVMIWGGFLYLTAGGDPGRASKGKTRITNALIGLVLAYGSYLLLYLINPALVQFKNFELITIRPVSFSAEDEQDGGDVTESAPSISPGANDSQLPTGPICRTVDDCRKYCNMDKGAWPPAVRGALNPADAVRIPAVQGLSNPNAKTGSQALVQALLKAAGIAIGKNSGYQLVVTSAYRPLADQITLVCNKIRAADQSSSSDQKSKILSSIGSAVAWPGGSNHGYGAAVDLYLSLNGKPLTVSGDCSSQGGSQWRAGSQALDEIMTLAGFRRYSKEIWHFEINTTNGSRCQFPGCAWPPSC